MKTPAIMLESVILFLICFLDTIYTCYLVSNKLAVEYNPLIAWTFNYGSWCFLLVKCITFIVPILILENIKNQSPKLICFLLRFGIIWYVLIYCFGTKLINH
jgi:uncharacterized membrane protein